VKDSKRFEDREVTVRVLTVEKYRSTRFEQIFLTLEGADDTTSNHSQVSIEAANVSGNSNSKLRWICR
jgi:hypothetical protein